MPNQRAVPRVDWTPGGGRNEWVDWAQGQLGTNPDYSLPSGWHTTDDGRVKQDFDWGQFIGKWAPVAGLAVGGGLALAPYLSGAAAGGGGAAAGTGGLVGSGEAAIGSSAIGAGATVPSIAGTAAGAAAPAAAAATGSGMNPLLWSALIQGGTSLLGGALSGSDQERQPYTGAVAPQQTLQDLFESIYNTGSGMSNAYSKGVQLHIPTPYETKPVSVPGLPFQIGGSINADPALRNMTLPGLDLHLAKEGTQGGGSGKATPRTPSGGSGRTRRRAPGAGKSE